MESRSRSVSTLIAVAALGLVAAGCGAHIESQARRVGRTVFPEHRGGVAVYSGKRKPQVPVDDVGWIKVTGERQPSREAMEYELRSQARKLGATAVINVQWHAEVRSEFQTARVLLQGAACLDDFRFCAFMGDGDKQVERVILSGFAVRVRRSQDEGS